MRWSLGLISDLAFFGWCIFIMTLLSFKGCTWEKEIKGKPNIQHGERVTLVGQAFDKPRDSVTYSKRHWGTYSKLIHKKPKRWGTYLEQQH